MIRYKQIILLLLFLFIGFQTTADAQQNRAVYRKKKGTKNAKQSTALRNAYQDMTARYNGYFHAKLIIQESLLKLSDSNKDNYEELLSIFEYQGGEKASTVHAQMDEAIKKASVDIKVHPNSKWVDDCYLLMAKAYFFKGDYDLALQNLKYVNTEFSQGIRRSEKYKKERGLKNRSYPSAGGKARAGVGGKSIDTDKAKELIKERVIEKNKKEQERKQKVKEREKNSAAKKKENEKKAKERAKIAKKRKKEQAKERAKKKKIQKKLKKMSPEKRKKYRAKLKAERQVQKEKDEAQKAEEEALKEDTIEEEEIVEEEETPKEATPEEEATEEIVEEEEEEKEVKRETEVEYKDSFLGKLGHRPARYESLMWLARTYIAQENYNKAYEMLELARNNNEYPKKYRGELQGIYAHYYLLQGDNDKAYAALNKSIKNTKGKRNRARLHYLQAQISVEQGEYQNAYNSFKRVIKSKPNKYEMEFNARLQIATTKMLAGDFNGDQAKRYLDKMLKDEKNEDFQDQIYFAMAEIDMAEGNVDEAMALLEKAAENSTVNKEQKALIFLKIAELFYEQEDYLKASYYYDSTAAYLPKEYPNREDIIARKDILAGLAGYYNTVEAEDSLQRIALMPEKKRNLFIDEIIERLEEEARARQEAASAEEESDFLTTSTSINATNPGGNTWYFYNDAAKSIGYNEFKSKWGNRPLQDNWRRKQTGFINTASADSEENTYIELIESGALNRDVLLANLPIGKEKMADSHNRIEYALYEIGNIYKDKLDNDEKAIESFNTLLERYPKGDYVLQSHYALYLLHKEGNNTAQANLHKDYIIKNDKDGVYANLIENPEYVEQVQEKDKKLIQFYEKTYKYYEKGEYEKVASRIVEADQKFEPNGKKPQFALLNAFVIGHTQEKPQYITALKDIVTSYPEDPVKDKAEEILNYIDKESKKAKTKKKNKKDSKYKVNKDSNHYFIVAFTQYTENISGALNNFSDYNTANNSLDKLKVTQMLLNPQNQILLVKTFPDGDKAMSYFNKVNEEQEILLENVKVSYQTFVISKKNFTQYFQSQNLQEYYDFFEEEYLDKG